MKAIWGAREECVTLAGLHCDSLPLRKTRDLGFHRYLHRATCNQLDFRHASTEVQLVHVLIREPNRDFEIRVPGSPIPSVGYVYTGALDTHGEYLHDIGKTGIDLSQNRASDCYCSTSLRIKANPSR
jgi:hypothetical protein